MNNIIQKLATLYELGRYKESVTLAVEHISEDTDANLYNYLIASLIQLDRYEEALKFCNEAKAIYPNEDSFDFHMAQIYFIGFNLIPDALNAIDNALRVLPNSTQYLGLKAEILMQKGRYFDASKTIREALELDPSNINNQLRYAQILYYLDGSHISKEIIADVLKLHPQNELALSLKEAIFTSNLSERYTILKSLLLNSPTDKSYIKKTKFIKLYYRYMPLVMGLFSIIYFIIQRNQPILGFLESYIIFLIAIISIVGSQNWKYNIVFLSTLLAVNAYFDNQELEIYLVLAISILAIILQALSYVAFNIISFIIHKISNIKGSKNG